MNSKFPSKTFLLGEYAVLHGGQALLLGHPPLFSSVSGPAGAERPFHPESPAGKWLAGHPGGGRLEFRDPHEGRGGFGGSGAEFLAAWVSSGGAEIPPAEAPRAIFAWSAWEDFRELGGSGSGADILTQAFGVNREQAFFLHVDLAGRQLSEVFPGRNDGELSLFHTGKKLPTHEQKAPDKLPLAELDELTLRACSALEEGLFPTFAEALGAYGEKLASLGLLAPHSAAALTQLKGTKKVLAAKGCGAMGTDVIAVAHQGADLTPWAAANSLAQVARFPV